MTEQLWRGTVHATYWIWMVLVGLAVAIGGTALLLWAPTPEGESAPTWAVVIPTAVGLFVIAAAVVFSSLELVMDHAGIRVTFGPWRWPRREIAWSAIASARALDVRAGPWGGWGYRWNPVKHGSAALLRSGPGIEFALNDGRIFIVTVDAAEAGAAVAGRQCRPRVPGS